MSENDNGDISTEGSESLLVVEPFYCGSHKQLVDLLLHSYDRSKVKLVTMPGKKWPWRSRTSALWLHSALPPVGRNVKTLFSSSVLNLAELVALRPDIREIPKKILYFHENQLVYPVRKSGNQERDFQFGYNQILSCLVADKIVFNSHFNMTSFLDSIKTFLSLMPDHRPKDLNEKISPKCEVLYFPLDLKDAQIQPSLSIRSTTKEPLHILWPHRWEHDKDPDAFFSVLFQLQNEGYSFRLSVLGEQFSEVPAIFQEAKQRLSNEIVHWGYLPNKEDYFSTLQVADVVVSTAKHEFFGVAMLEAVHYGCYPLAPRNLVYPELYPSKHLFNTTNQLYKLLRNFCKNPSALRQSEIDIDTSKFSWNLLSSKFQELLDVG